MSWIDRCISRGVRLTRSGREVDLSDFFPRELLTRDNSFVIISSADGRRICNWLRVVTNLLAKKKTLENLAVFSQVLFAASSAYSNHPNLFPEKIDEIFGGNIVSFLRTMSSRTPRLASLIEMVNPVYCMSRLHRVACENFIDSYVLLHGLDEEEIHRKVFLPNLEIYSYAGFLSREFIEVMLIEFKYMETD